MKAKNKTRWGNTQTVQVKRDMFFTSPLEGCLVHTATRSAPLAGEVRRRRVGGVSNSASTLEDVRGKNEGVLLKSLLTPPHPAFGHPLPQGARRSMFGFTLIELLVVVLIIGILAAVAVPQYQYVTERSRAVQAHLVAESVLKAERLFYLQNDRYTTNFEELDISYPGSLSDDKTKVYLRGYTVKLHPYYVQIDSAVYRAVYMVYYFGGSRKDCRADKTGPKYELGKKICLSLGGKYQAWDDNQSYTLYSLP